MKAGELDFLLLLAKSANIFYLTGDGRMRAYSMIMKEI